MDIRKKLGLLVLEEESDEAGIERITQDQLRRTEIRKLGQILKASQTKKPRVKKEKSDDTLGNKKRVRSSRKKGTNVEGELLPGTSLPSKRKPRTRKTKPKEPEATQDSGDATENPESQG